MVIEAMNSIKSTTEGSPNFPYLPVQVDNVEVVRERAEETRAIGEVVWSFWGGEHGDCEESCGKSRVGLEMRRTTEVAVLGSYGNTTKLSN